MEHDNMLKHFCAGIVLFNPDDETFIISIQELIGLGIGVYVFDNSTDEQLIQKNKRKIELKFGNNVVFFSKQAGNVGLSLAFNLIVKAVLKEDIYKGIFLFDQDTFINKDALVYLMNSFNNLQKENVNFGILAGYPIRKDGIPYRIKPVSKANVLTPDLVAVSEASSSYSLFQLSTFEKIGFFDERFFIDHIDMDFSTRCLQNNLPIYINTKAKFTHNIGVGDVKLFGYHLFPFADDYRHYYQVRNMILSGKKNKISVINISLSITIRVLVVTVIALTKGKAISRFRYLYHGIIDGFKNIGGICKYKF